MGNFMVFKDQGEQSFESALPAVNAALERCGKDPNKNKYLVVQILGVVKPAPTFVSLGDSTETLGEILNSDTPESSDEVPF